MRNYSELSDNGGIIAAGGTHLDTGTVCPCGCLTHEVAALWRAIEAVEEGRPGDVCPCGCLEDYLGNVLLVALPPVPDPELGRSAASLWHALRLVEEGRAGDICRCGHLSASFAAVLEAGRIGEGGSHSAERAERYDSVRYDDLRADSFRAAEDGRYGEALDYLRRAAAATGNVGMARLVDDVLAGLAEGDGQEGGRP